MTRDMCWQLSNIVNDQLIQTKGRESVFCCFRTSPVVVPGAPYARQNAAITDSQCLGADRCLSAGEGAHRVAQWTCSTITGLWSTGFRRIYTKPCWSGWKHLASAAKHCMACLTASWDKCDGSKPLTPALSRRERELICGDLVAACVSVPLAWPPFKKTTAPYFQIYFIRAWMSNSAAKSTRQKPRPFPDAPGLLLLTI